MGSLFSSRALSSSSSCVGLSCPSSCTSDRLSLSLQSGTSLRLAGCSGRSLPLAETSSEHDSSAETRRGWYSEGQEAQTSV